MHDWIASLSQSVSFGLMLSIGAYWVGIRLNRRFPSPLCNPLLIAILLVIGVLVVFRIDYQDYNRGGELLSYLLTPATVAFAVPLYRQLSVLRRNWPAILAGVGAGCLASISGVYLLSRVFSLSPELYYTLIPKSITSAIGVGVAEELGGIPAVTVPVIILTGILGAIFAEGFLRLCRISDRISTGLAIGTASHAIGASRAFQLGEVEGAMASLAIVISGLATVLLAPLAAMLL